MSIGISHPPFRFQGFALLPSRACLTTTANCSGKALEAGAFRVMTRLQMHVPAPSCSGKWVLEAQLSSRSLISSAVFLGALLVGCSSPQSQTPQAPAVTVLKQPPTFASHTFDPAAPPPDMPPLAPGESAECDSNFMSSARLHAKPRKTDATHTTLTITQIELTLNLDVNIWLPAGAAQNVIDHEEGHRQISEYYYQTADKLAQRIAASYVGKPVEVQGTDLTAESNNMLQQLAAEITAEYGKQLDPGPSQLLYDDITDHARNAVIARDAVDHALKNIAVEPAPPAQNPGN